MSPKSREILWLLILAVLLGLVVSHCGLPIIPAG